MVDNSNTLDLSLDAAILHGHYYLIGDYKAVLSPKYTQQPYQKVDFNKLLEQHKDILINEGALNSLLLPQDYLSHLQNKTEDIHESSSSSIITYILLALLVLLVVMYIYFTN